MPDTFLPQHLCTVGAVKDNPNNFNLTTRHISSQHFQSLLLESSYWRKTVSARSPLLLVYRSEYGYSMYSITAMADRFPKLSVWNPITALQDGLVA